MPASATGPSVEHGVVVGGEGMEKGKAGKGKKKSRKAKDGEEKKKMESGKKEKKKDGKKKEEEEEKAKAHVMKHWTSSFEVDALISSPRGPPPVTREFFGAGFGANANTNANGKVLGTKKSSGMLLRL
ncbi:hypothetical protein CVT25_011521 [Psilocybe cyanescens]|uniref:Uncharacterized protein n=1 Tax=Psilocybe cyanescens TaxID=93625 RepID=A0A409XUU0_PSICY|nr:hypothetical protein CVT25_011521 [Psilocybe cyanescens]